MWKPNCKALGCPGGALTNTASIMNYVSGCVKRERERQAEIFRAHGMSELADALMDETKDDLVFKWQGPGSRLADPPAPVTEK